MNCPFCAEEIKDNASVCRCCGRDLSISKAVYEQLRASSARIEALDARVQAIEQAAALPGTISAVGAVPASVPPSLPDSPTEWIKSFLAVVSLLVAVYVVVVIKWDTRPWVLRAGLIAVAATAGFVDARNRGRSALAVVSLAVAAGIGAILAMDELDFLIEHAPFSLSGAELREEVSYMASVGFSYFTGVLALQWLRARDGQLPALTAKLALGAARLGRSFGWLDDFERRARTTQTLINTAVLTGSALTALFTGLHNLLK